MKFNVQISTNNPAELASLFGAYALVSTGIIHAFASHLSEDDAEQDGGIAGNVSAGSDAVNPAAAPTAPAGSDAGWPAPDECAITVDDIVAFLEGDDRYEMRSFGAVAEFYSGVPEEKLQALLSEGISRGVIRLRHRISDGAPLYEAA